MTANLKRKLWNQPDLAPGDGVELLGELHPLLEQLGSFDGLVTLNTASTSWAGPAVESYETLAIFLESYRSQILLPMDLPAIQRAFNHASRNETRELIALDLEVARQPVLREFASASQRVGKCQLRRRSNSAERPAHPGEAANAEAGIFRPAGWLRQTPSTTPAGTRPAS